MYTESKYKFENDVSNDVDLLNLIMDETFAKNLYASLCNVIWKKDHEEVLMSWRSAGDLVARLRNARGGLNESYMDYYCSGYEGVVFADVKEVLTNLGWSPTII